MLHSWMVTLQPPAANPTLITAIETLDTASIYMKSAE